MRSALEQAYIEQQWFTERSTITCGYDRCASVKAEVVVEHPSIKGTLFAEQCIVDVHLPTMSSSAKVHKWELLGIRCQLH